MLRRALSTVALSAAVAAAQTGPFQDGELLIHNPGVSGPQLIRVDPSTGQAAVLLDALYWGGWADSMVYDSYRGAVVACLSMAPDPYWKYRAWVIESDGTATAIPGIEAQTMHGMEAIGDGRIYFQRKVHGNTTIEYLDAANQIHTLMDETGLAPVAVAVEHMLYDPVGDALIATANPSWTVGGCGDPTKNTVYRIPLSPDGSRLAAPVTCVSLVASTLNGMGLSRLPDGRVLATYAGTASFGFPYPEKLWSIDPTTLGAVLWSSSDLTDLNGGVYSTRLGKAVVFDDVANELRSYGQGQGGDGTLLPVSLPIGDGTTGFSPGSNMVQLDVPGPGCQGGVVSHGVGLAGAGGLVPTLGAVGCPDLGLTWSLALGQLRGGAFGILFAGTGTTAIPFKGGLFYVDGLALSVSFIASGTPGVAGDGGVNLPVVLNEPGLSGFEIVLQAGCTDTGAVFGVSLSNALRVTGF